MSFWGGKVLGSEPMHYVEPWPGPLGSVYTFHRTALVRDATATADLGGDSLGTSLSGSFFRVHDGETFVSRDGG